MRDAAGESSFREGFSHHDAYCRLCGEGSHCRFKLVVKMAVAPVIEGIKPAALFRIPRSHFEGVSWIITVQKECFLCGLRIIILHAGTCSSLVFAYEQNALRRVIAHSSKRRFLASLGYPVSEGVDACLLYMKTQFEKGFPHEIGVFLGYPLADVISFMSGIPQKNIACGYWKVYHRPERAERIFAQIRRARNRALLELLAEYYPEEFSRTLAD